MADRGMIYIYIYMFIAENAPKVYFKNCVYFPQFDGQDVLVPYTHYQRKKGIFFELLLVLKSVYDK